MSNKTDVAANYHLLKLIESRPEVSQRELAREMGLSLGKVNYCLNALIGKGCIKVNNFRNSGNNELRAIKAGDREFFIDVIDAKENHEKKVALFPQNAPNTA